MKIPSKSLIAVALVSLFTGAVFAQGVTSTTEPVAAVDDIPPAPVTQLQALDTSVDEAESVVLTWTISADDAISYNAFGGSIVPWADVRGYRIYRKSEGEELLIATVGSGVTEYTDENVESEVTYTYAVRPFDLDNETPLGLLPGSDEDLARIVLVGGPADADIATVTATMSFDIELDLEDEVAVDEFVTDFVALVAQLLGIDPARIKVTDVSAGSVVVEFEIVDFEGGSEDEPVAVEALTQLIERVEEDTEVFADLGPILEVTSPDVEPVVEPTDPDGNLILGWFTREGASVDFDDFFLFADHFGTEEGDEGFDLLFDIVTNGSVDFNDFFRFADDFGKTVVNADEVRAQM